MYNGIGLATPRGSGTNGYVQKNLAHVTERPASSKFERVDFSSMDKLATRTANKDILLHDQKRQVEVQCMMLANELEEKGLPEEEVEEQVQQLRQRLNRNLDSLISASSVSASHKAAEAKITENERVARALGIKQSEHQVGAAFNRELQEAKRVERLEKRAKEDEARQKVIAARETERAQMILRRIVRDIADAKRPQSDLAAAEEELGVKTIADPFTLPTVATSTVPLTQRQTWQRALCLQVSFQIATAHSTSRLAISLALSLDLAFSFSFSFSFSLPCSSSEARRFLFALTFAFALPIATSQASTSRLTLSVEFSLPFPLSFPLALAFALPGPSP
ncbi:RNA-splicing factor [Sorochytrium milnesiophthora]